MEVSQKSDSYYKIIYFEIIIQWWPDFRKVRFDSIEFICKDQNQIWLSFHSVQKTFFMHNELILYPYIYAAKKKIHAKMILTKFCLWFAQHWYGTFSP